ncbi:hypothetical protein [Anaerobranca gottschalkii]|uniref:Uncharacterized protein n=1 Tax=Anaerobranca gottschalkii DSM 13577 TaxID=1120990 RepID=A0A1I0CPN1_9FIRM|nr:hypothetical protein [Anaerobranca gottschalkii]SET21684.1 hypothetical protein SAMN03080614_10865 [Anaerobranca gottschalkii DSM 13577]
MYLLQIIKLKNSLPFILSIALYFVMLFIFYIIYILTGYDLGNILLKNGEEFFITHYADMAKALLFSLENGNYAIFQGYVALIIPIVLSISFSFPLSKEWELKTIKVEEIYFDNRKLFFTRMLIYFVLLNLMVLLTVIFNIFFTYITSRFLASNIENFKNLLDVYSINAIDNIVIYIRIYLLIVFVSLLLYILGYLFTYSFSTNIYFVIFLILNLVFMNLYIYSPIFMYKYLLDKIFYTVNEQDLLSFLLKNNNLYQLEIDYFVNPLVIKFLLTIIALVVLFVFLKKRSIY